MTISVFGNPDLPDDAVPIVLIPELQKRFPDISFVHQDPNEECLPPEASAKGGSPWYIIDTVQGISDVTIITDADIEKAAKRITLHDYDLGMHLTLLKKLNPNLQIRIIGVPMAMDKATALEKVAQTIEVEKISQRIKADYH